MKIEGYDSGKITVALSGEDMHELDITYEDMDYSNIETRRVIWTVLDRAKECTGASISTDGRLLIEVCPAENGGCTMVFTVEKSKDGTVSRKPVMKKGPEPVTVCTCGKDALISAYNRLKCESEKIENAAYRRFDGYDYLVVFPKAMQSTDIAYILSEYGEVFENCRAFAFTVCEHGCGTDLLFK